MSGISLEELPDAGAPQVGITVDGLDGGSTSVISVEVSWDEGVTWHAVRGAQRISVVGATFVRDHVAPLNVLATYRLVVHSGVTVPATLDDTITVVSEFAWLQDPLAPRTAVPVRAAGNGDALLLLSGSAASVTRAQASDVVSVQGSRYPVASVGRRQAPSNVPLFLHGLAASQGALVNDLRTLFDQAGTVVIRGLPTFIPLDAVATVLPGDVEEIPLSTSPARNDWVLNVTQVRPTSMRVVVPWWTYDQVEALWAVDSSTYDDALAARPGDTYIDWLRSPEVP